MPFGEWMGWISEPSSKYGAVKCKERESPDTKLSFARLHVNKIRNGQMSLYMHKLASFYRKSRIESNSNFQILVL